MSDCAKSQGAQCWICPQCYDDKHHEPGDMRCLQQQKKEAMAIASLNQLENRSLRQQLAESEARVAELEKDNAHQRERRNAARDCINKMNGPWLTRKKAEGIDEAARELMPRVVGAPDDPMPEFNAACEMCGEFMDYAQRLRNQADEAERAGGEQ